MEGIKRVEAVKSVETVNDVEAIQAMADSGVWRGGDGEGERKEQGKAGAVEGKGEEKGEEKMKAKGGKGEPEEEETGEEEEGLDSPLVYCLFVWPIARSEGRREGGRIQRLGTRKERERERERGFKFLLLRGWRGWRLEMEELEGGRSRFRRQRS